MTSPTDLHLDLTGANPTGILAPGISVWVNPEKLAMGISGSANVR